MTVPQHRLVVKGAADRWGSRRAEERAGATHKPECRAMRNASGALLLPALALGGEQLRRQEGRLPRCLKGGMLLLTPTPAPRSSPGRNKAPAPHWTEHVASLPHSRGALLQLRPRRQGAVTEGEEEVSTKAGARSTSAEKMVASLLYNQKRQ